MLQQCAVAAPPLDRLGVPARGLLEVAVRLRQYRPGGDQAVLVTDGVRLDLEQALGQRKLTSSPRAEKVTPSP